MHTVFAGRLQLLRSVEVCKSLALAGGESAKKVGMLWNFHNVVDCMLRSSNGGHQSQASAPIKYHQVRPNLVPRARRGLRIGDSFNGFWWGIFPISSANIFHVFIALLAHISKWLAGQRGPLAHPPTGCRLAQSTAAPPPGLKLQSDRVRAWKPGRLVPDSSGCRPPHTVDAPPQTPPGQA